MIVVFILDAGGYSTRAYYSVRHFTDFERLTGKTNESELRGVIVSANMSVGVSHEARDSHY